MLIVFGTSVLMYSLLQSAPISERADRFGGRAARLPTAFILKTDRPVSFGFQSELVSLDT